MSIRGGRLPSICSQFQTFLNLVRGGGSEFFNNFWNSKSSELSEGGGGIKPNWEFFPNFPVFFSDAFPHCWLVGNWTQNNGNNLFSLRTERCVRRGVYIATVPTPHSWVPDLAMDVSPSYILAADILLTRIAINSNLEKFDEKLPEIMTLFIFLQEFEEGKFLIS